MLTTVDWWCHVLSDRRGFLTKEATDRATPSELNNYLYDSRKCGYYANPETTEAKAIILDGHPDRLGFWRYMLHCSVAARWLTSFCCFFRSITLQAQSH